MSLSFLSAVRRFPVFLSPAKLAAAVLVAMLMAGPVWAGPEIWLQHGGRWSKDEISFNLNCSAKYAILPDGHTFDHDNPIDNIPLTDTSSPTPTWNAPGGYPASTYIQVEVRGAAGNVGDQEELPANHPGRAWGKTMWCQLWNGCTIVKPMELDIQLTSRTSNQASPVTLSDRSSSATGQEIRVTRRHATWPNDVTVGRLCTSATDHPGTVTVRAVKIDMRELN